MVTYLDLPSEIKAQVKSGEVVEIDMLDGGAGTWIKYVDVDLGYYMPVFVAGDETVFSRHERTLIDDAQDNHQICRTE